MRSIAIVTGSRAEFGLLRPVMRAVRARTDARLMVIAAGSHLVSPAETYREVKDEFASELVAAVPMQVAGRTGRFEDAEALGVGVSRFARVLGQVRPEWVVVLGDRIEALAAASASSVAGIGLVHVHGGDRAEGVADEAIRHAISKLAHLHFPATASSGERLRRMGETAVHVVGSPAIDGLESLARLDDERFAALGSPEIAVLFHPIGRSDDAEEAATREVLAATRDARTLALLPNVDPGRNGIVRAIERSGVSFRTHLPRAVFIGLLRRIADARGALVGNSSAALIEAAALRCAAVDIGARQDGRERVGNVVICPRESADAIADAIVRARALDLATLEHPYGDGHAGERIARILAAQDPAPLIRKRNAY